MDRSLLKSVIITSVAELEIYFARARYAVNLEFDLKKVHSFFDGSGQVF